MHIFKTGELIYYDSMRGLVKGKIINITWDYKQLNPKVRLITPNSQKIIIRVTSKNHPIYKAGETIESSRLWIIPRDKVYIRSGQYRIAPY